MEWCRGLDPESHGYEMIANLGLLDSIGWSSLESCHSPGTGFEPWVQSGTELLPYAETPHSHFSVLLEYVGTPYMSDPL